MLYTRSNLMRKIVFFCIITIFFSCTNKKFVLNIDNEKSINDFIEQHKQYLNRPVPKDTKQIYGTGFSREIETKKDYILLENFEVVDKNNKIVKRTELKMKGSNESCQRFFKKLLNVLKLYGDPVYAELSEQNYRQYAHWKNDNVFILLVYYKLKDNISEICLYVIPKDDKYALGSIIGM